MRMLKYWKIDICGLIILLIIGCFVWLGNKKIDGNNFHIINHSCLSNQKNNMLEKLKNDFAFMDQILYASSNYLSILTSNNGIINYKYEHGAIWYNDEPLINRVKSFHFEYRDSYGNLLTNFKQNYISIETIGYIIRRENNKEKIIYKNMISVPNKMLSYTNNL